MPIIIKIPPQGGGKLNKAAKRDVTINKLIKKLEEIYRTDMYKTIIRSKYSKSRKSEA